MTTEAQHILSLIESVSPDNNAKLSEINAKVELYLGNSGNVNVIEIKKENNSDEWVVRKSFTLFGREHDNWYAPTDYTGSRDALKQIRPDGWFPVSYFRDSDLKCVYILEKFGTGTDYQGNIETAGKALSTEELAELHAIIQAIEHNRSEK